MYYINFYTKYGKTNFRLERYDDLDISYIIYYKEVDRNLLFSTPEEANEFIFILMDKYFKKRDRLYEEIEALNKKIDFEADRKKYDRKIKIKKINDLCNE